MSGNKKICSYCFELILPSEKHEKIKLTDQSEILVHFNCLEEMMEGKEGEEENE